MLFVDVVGSTAMGQQLDPETIHEVMDSALERFTAAVRRDGGRVLQYTGDGMLAAFGTEAAGEDDVEVAIRAGLGIVEDGQAPRPQVRAQHGVPDFNVRVGVHTGRVLLGGGVDAEGSIRGATVNVAARMEQSAPPGRAARQPRQLASMCAGCSSSRSRRRSASRASSSRCAAT